MQIAVAVREVAAVDDDFTIDGTTIPDRYLDYDLNEWDEYALEAAVRISEEHEDVEVVVLTIGPDRAEETIRQALAKGADRAVRIWDEALAGRQFLSIHARVALLAAALADEDPALVLTGVQASDDAFGATGVALAQQLGVAWAAVVNHLALDADAATARVHRELEGSTEEVTDVPLPAVLTIQSGINEPRYASLRDIRRAQRKELATKDLAALGLDAAALDSPVELTRMERPTTDGTVELFDGPPEAAATDLAAVLRDSGVTTE